LGGERCWHVRKKWKKKIWGEGKGANRFRDKHCLVRGKLKKKIPGAKDPLERAESQDSGETRPQKKGSNTPTGNVRAFGVSIQLPQRDVGDGHDQDFNFAVNPTVT